MQINVFSEYDVYLTDIDHAVLALVGGGTVGQTARHIMKKLMSDNVAVSYNFKGKGAKRSFAALNLKSIVCGMFICAQELSV